MLSPGNSAEIAGNSAVSGNSAEICRHFFWLYWGKHSTINSAEIGLQWWNSAESRFKSEIWKFCRNPKSAKTSIPRGSKVWTICMHLGMHALRASDHAICGLTMIFACISDSLFSDWFPINSDSLWGIAADLVTVCHGLSRRFPTMPKI